MASFASVHVSTANKTLVPWSVVLLDPSQNFGELFWSLQAGKYTIIKTSTELTAAILDSSGVSVGKDKSSLFLVENYLNTADICTAFGHFIKFTVPRSRPVFRRLQYGKVVSSPDPTLSRGETFLAGRRGISLCTDLLMRKKITGLPQI